MNLYTLFVNSGRILPEFTKSVYKFMKLEDPVWSDIQNDLVDTEINKFESIITRIDDNHINKMMES